MDANRTAERESLILRAVWMLVFFFAWQLAELLLVIYPVLWVVSIVAVVLLQLVLRLMKGQPDACLQAFGDSLSQYIAQIGRFGTFNTDHKPWPLSDWPTARPADLQAAPRSPSEPEPPRQEPAP